MVKSKKTHTKCGFLRGIGPARLRRMHKEEENPKERDRLLAYAMRKEGMSVYAIVDSLNKPYSTTRDWLGRAVNDGLGGTYDETRPGVVFMINNHLSLCRQRLIERHDHGASQYAVKNQGKQVRNADFWGN